MASFRNHNHSARFASHPPRVQSRRMIRPLRNKLSINQTDRRISVITAISVNPVWSEQKIVAMARQVENSPNTFTSNFLIYMHTNARA